jgi:hypothetical protein
MPCCLTDILRRNIILDHRAYVDIPEPLPGNHLDHVLHHYIGHYQHSLPGDLHDYHSKHLRHLFRQHQHKLRHFFGRQHYGGVLGWVAVLM